MFVPVLFYPVLFFLIQVDCFHQIRPGLFFSYSKPRRYFELPILFWIGASGRQAGKPAILLNFPTNCLLRHPGLFRSAFPSSERVGSGRSRCSLPIFLSFPTDASAAAALKLKVNSLSAFFI